MKRRKSVAIQLAILLGLSGVAATLWVEQDSVAEVFAAISGGDKDTAERRSNRKSGVPVVVARVGQRANDVTIEAIATARARRFVTLFPEVPGQVVSFDVQAGDPVKAGEKILSLDSRDAELAVNVTHVRLKEAKLHLERSRQLRNRRVNSRANVEDMEAMVQRTALELDQALEALSKRTIRAPFAGIVGIPKVEVGDRVATTTPLITIDDRRVLLVEIEVPEQFFAAVAKGQKVTALTPSFPGRSFQGTIDRIDSRIEPTSRTVMVRASLPNQHDALRPGMSFAVELTISGETYPTIPELALQWKNGKSYVWRVQDGRTARVNVRSIKRFSQDILVSGDIKKGDLVVVEGVQRLRPGRKVNYVPLQPAPGS